MAKKKNHSLPFDSRGGVTRIQRVLLNSKAFLELSAQAKVLLFLMQEHWRNDKPVDFGVREAQEKIPCAKGTAASAFRQLAEAGFIVLVDESLFSSRTQSKARTWRLNWLPWQGKYPTNEWEKK
jgi:hypothetical protein